MFELSALGSGRVVIDDVGVARKRLRGDQFLAWEHIEAYFLTIKITAGGGMFLDELVPLFSLLSINDDDVQTRFGIELRGGDTRLDFNWRFDAAERAIKMVFSRIHPALIAATRKELRETGEINAGDLRIAATELVWGDREPLLLDEVEAFELCDENPIRLRVMKHDMSSPYAKAPLQEIKNVIEVFDVARELGYPVRGIGLLDGLREVTN